MNPTDAKINEILDEKQSLKRAFDDYAAGIKDENIRGFMYAGFLTGASYVLSFKDEPERLQKFLNELLAMHARVTGGSH